MPEQITRLRIEFNTAAGTHVVEHHGAADSLPAAWMGLCRLDRLTAPQLFGPCLHFLRPSAPKPGTAARIRDLHH